MSEKCVIIGASHAAAQLAASLRQEGWEGSITMIGDEAQAPYQRPPLSKTFLAGEKTAEDLLIRPMAIYEKLNIDLKLDTSVTSINRSEKQLKLDNNESLEYDRLVLCVGARARQLPLPGSDLAGVHYLRSIKDVQAIQQDIATANNVLIVGGGYIGLETAASLNKLGKTVTVLEMMDRVLQRVTATEVSDFFNRVHSEEGVTIKTNVSVSALLSDNGNYVTSVQCQDGSTMEADLVIIGAGIIPNVELAQEAGLEIDDGVVVDEYGRTSDPDIFAAGDCTKHPNKLLGRQLRLESVPNAMEQAKTVAATLCGKQKPYAAHPWFWSDQYDIKLQIAGLNQGYDQVLIRGDHHQGRSFVAWYLKAGQLLAADCINRPAEFMVTKQLLQKNIAVKPDELIDDSLTPKDLLANE